MKDVLEGTRGLAKNPLGIIALFVAFVYGLAALVLGVSVQHLQGTERLLLVGFVVGFPILVLIAFSILVVWHHKKLYGPGDYRDDESFLRTLGPVEREVRLEAKVSGAIAAESQRNPEDSSADEQANAGARPTPDRQPGPAIPTATVSTSLSSRVRDVTSLGLLVVGRRLNLPIQPEVAIGTGHSVPFDGGWASDSEYLLVETKYLPRNWVSLRSLQEIVERVQAAETRLRHLGDSRKLVLFLLLVTEDASTEQVTAIRSKADQILSKAGVQTRFDVLTIAELRNEAVGRQS